MTTAIASPSLLSTAPAQPAASAQSDDDDFSFHDLVSIVNPLQHLPVVSTLYRAVTGDTIKPFERIAGDTLYGGLWGFISSVANFAFQEVTGKDFGDTALAMLEGDDSTTTAVADNSAATNAATQTGIAQAAIPVSASLGGAVVASTAMPSMVASAPPHQLMSPSLQTTAPASSASAALAAAMQAKGIDPALSQRALSAYQKSLTLAPAATSPSNVPTS